MPPPSQANASSSNSPALPNGRSSPSPPENDNEKHEPEDASTSHTVTTQNKNPSSAPPRKSNISSENLPHTNGSASRHSPSKSSPPSLFSRLFRALVPCVAPSSRAHPPEIDIPRSPKPVSPPQEKSESVSQKPQQSSPPLQDEQQQQLQSTDHQKISSTFVPTSNPEPSPPISSTSEQPPSQETSNMEQSSREHDQPSLSTPLLPVASEVDPETVLSPRVEPKPSSADDETNNNRTSTAPSNATIDADDSEGTSFTEDDDMDEVNGIDDEDEDELVIRNGGAGIPIGPDGVPRPLLPPIAPQHAGRKCLVLDLDETLVHSSFKSIQQADYVVPVEIEYHWHNVYVIKRPGVDNFLKKMGEIYEVVVFTASLSKYADPVLDKLDIHQVVSHRLFRESCYNHRGNYVKDLSQLGRPIADTIILDNSPASYIFHPNNAVPVSSWFNDPHDTELTDLVPFLSDLSSVDDVRGVLDGAR